MKYFILILAVFTVSCSSNQPKTDWDIEGLKNNVKEVWQIDYGAIDKFGEGEIVRSSPQGVSKYILFDSIGNYQTIYKYQLKNVNIDTKRIYDENNFLIYDVNYNEDGELSYGHEIINDAKGNPVEYIDVINGDIDRGYTTYDENGNLTLHHIKGRTEFNKWLDNKLVEKKVMTKYFSSYPPSIDNIYYYYDDRGNLIKEKKNGYYCEEFEWIFDDKNRMIHQKWSKARNKDTKFNIESIAKAEYSSDSATKPYIIEFWDGEGRLKAKEYKYWICDNNDTITNISLDKDFHIYSIETITKYKSKKEVCCYWVGAKCDVINEDFTIVDGKKILSLDKLGNKVIYEYEGDELIRKTACSSTSKKIITYKNNREKSSIVYDNNGKIIESKEITYKGTIENSAVSAVITFENGSIWTIETLFENGKKVKEKRTTDNIADDTYVEYKYNSLGDIIEISTKDGEVVTFQYRYDKFDNWVVRNTFINGKIDCISERSIAYY